MPQCFQGSESQPPWLEAQPGKSSCNCSLLCFCSCLFLQGQESSFQENQPKVKTTQAALTMALEITGANSCHFLSFGLDAIFLISPRPCLGGSRAPPPALQGPTGGQGQEVLRQQPGPANPPWTSTAWQLDPHCSLSELTKWQLIKIHEYFCATRCAGTR